MNNKTLNRAFTLLLFFIFLTSNVYSQEDNKFKSSVEVTVLASAPGTTELQNEVLQLCRRELDSFHIPKSEKPEWTLLLNANESKGHQNDLIVISVTILQALPKEIIDFCSKNEAFYLLAEKNKKEELPKEGKFIREHVTSSFLSQFSQIRENDIFVTTKSKLKITCAGIIKKFINR